MNEFYQDFRFAVRMVGKNPGFSLVVILALALGIGANTAIFSVIDAVLLRSLPYPDPDRLVMIWGNFVGIGLPKNQNWISAPEFVDIRQHSQCFSHVAAYAGSSFNIMAGNVPERIDGAVATADFFTTLGMQPHLGRLFGPGDDQPGNDDVVIIGHGLWQRRFGADPALLQRPITVNGRPYTVIGIAPAGFRFPEKAEMWTPLAFSTDALRSRGAHGYQVIARIKPELSPGQARADAQTVTDRIIKDNRDYPYDKFQFHLILNPILEEMVGDLRTALWIIMASVGFVLLIACANVANLLLVRAGIRERELAIRTALGAGRWRLIRQLLTESTLLAFLGAALGLLWAHWSQGVLIRIGSVSFPRIAAARLDMRVLGFTLLVAIITGLVFGIVPALHASRVPPDALKEGGRGLTAGRGTQVLRRFLVAGEIALSLILLIGAGLLLKSFYRLRQVNPGFQPERVLTFRLSLPSSSYPESFQVTNFYREILRRIESLPGVTSAGAVSALPLSGSGSSGTTTVESRAVAPDNSSPEADWRAVTPGFFEALGIKLISGRDFSERDTEKSTPVAIIDETMARTYWPQEDAIGKRLKLGGQQSANPWMTVVGIVRHVRYASLEKQSRVEVYWPHAQRPYRGMSIALRTAVDPGSLRKAIQIEVSRMDANQPAYLIQTMDELLADSVARQRFSMLLLAVLAGIALALAGIGIYGVVSYAVAQRTHEMGVRIALGASRASVLRLVLSQSMSVAVVGVGLGVAGSLVLMRFLSTLLFDVQPRDPWTFTVVPLFLAVVAFIASYIPARRATRVDPMIALRYE